MMIIMERLKRFYLSGAIRQFLRFAVVGVANTGVDFIIFSIVHGIYGIHPIFSQVISYSCGVLNSYILNRLWTFRVRNRARIKEFLSFLAINLLSLGTSIVIIYILIDLWFLNVYLAKGAATMIALVINFIGSKLFVFKSAK